MGTRQQAEIGPSSGQDGIDLIHILNCTYRHGGNFGFIASAEGATESDVLRMLLDCGGVVAVLYIVALALLGTRA